MNRRTAMVGAVSSAIALAGCADDVARGIEDASSGEDSDGFEGSLSDGGGISVPYKDYDSTEADAVREGAEAIEFNELYRNVEDYEGDAVRYQVRVVQVLEDDSHFILRVNFDNDYFACSWVGDRVIEGDEIELWGEVLGLATYESSIGGEETVPAISIADLEVLEEAD